MKDKREIFFDIVKGIGIISIVLGHVTPSGYVCLFVYMYHLAIFYFVSAYFYNEKKYGDDPAKNFTDRVKSNWVKYVFYCIILVLLHNTFVKYHFLSPMYTAYKTPKKFIPAILNTLTFACPEFLAGAMWFLPTLIFALTMFGIIVYLARKISNKGKTEKNKKIIKYIVIIIFSVICGRLGVYLNINKIHLSYSIQTSFLILPICTLGYFFREYKNIINIIKKNYVAIPTLILTTAIIVYAVVEKGFHIDLSDKRIINGYMFYIMSFIGILFCLTLSAIIEKIPKLNKSIALLGKHSFAIMALHFASIKLVDVIYSKIIDQRNPVIISRWVTAYTEELWLIYLVVGCGLPLAISIILEKIKKLFKKKNLLGGGEECQY